MYINQSNKFFKHIAHIYKYKREDTLPSLSCVQASSMVVCFLCEYEQSVNFCYEAIIWYSSQLRGWTTGIGCYAVNDKRDGISTIIYLYLSLCYSLGNCQEARVAWTKIFIIQPVSIECVYIYIKYILMVRCHSALWIRHLTKTAVTWPQTSDQPPSLASLSFGNCNQPLKFNDR